MEIYIFLCCLGMLTGILSGLLGIGGGLIIVPSLVFFFKKHAIPPNILMQLAVGTSLAIIVPTTCRSLISHLRFRTEMWPIYRKLFPGIILGAILGATIASHLHSRILILLFAVFMLISSLKMFYEKTNTNSSVYLPNSWVMHGVGLTTGISSALLGVGGGFLIMPFLNFCQVKIHDALTISLATALTIAFIGTLSFMANGLHSPDLPAWTTGYIYWPVWLPITIGSVMFAPIGTRLSHFLPIKTLKRIFALLWLVVSIRMFFLSPGSSP